MINPTKQLNEIIRSISTENANTSVSQLAAIVDLCSKAGIRFSFDNNHEKEWASFTASKFPEFNAEVTNTEIDSLARYGKYEKAIERRDKALSLINEIQRQYRLSKYGTEDWFMEKSESEIFFIPTEIAIIDNLMVEKFNEK